MRTEKEEMFESLATEAQVNDIMLQVFDVIKQKYIQRPAVTEHPEAVGNAADSTNKK